MKPRELFGVAVRVIGLVNLIYMLASALLLFGSGFCRVVPAVRIILWALFSIWLLRGAPQLVNVAYSGERYGIKVLRQQRGRQPPPTSQNSDEPRNKALWEKGDFTAISVSMRESGEAIVNSLGVKPSDWVLDLGCGDGTTAVPLARTGASVLGVDIAQNLVAAGNKRAAELGLKNLKFQEGDACQLAGIGDATFDLDDIHFRRDVCPEAPRRHQGGLPRHQARWPDRRGQLDPP